MKNLLIIVCTALCLTSQAQEIKTYAVKSGYVKYQLSGSAVGTRELWWDDYGQKTYTLEESTTTTKIFGIKNTDETHTATLIVKDQFWEADYLNKSGMNGTLPLYNESQAHYGNLSEKEQEEFADDLLRQMGGQKLGTETFNGYTCDLIKLMGIKSWVYKGVTLKTEGKIMGIKINEEMLDFKPNTTVSSSKFTPPSGVEYETIEAQPGAQGLMAVFNEIDNLAEETPEDDIIPVTYSFEQFTKVVKACNIDNYRNVNINSMDGVHSATYMQGLNTIMVIAQSDDNIEDDQQISTFESFRYDGHTCRYGQIKEENSSMLIVEYPSDDMVVIFVSMPAKDKDELMKIEHKMQF